MLTSYVLFLCSAKFSKGAEDKMLKGCPGCPYPDFKYFNDYYGTPDYAHQWVEAAFAGESTKFSRGNADFSKFGFDGREQAIKKGTAYMNIFMYVIREFEDALDDCKRGILEDNYNSVHAWDEGVCFYTGSIEVCLSCVMYCCCSIKLLVNLLLITLISFPLPGSRWCY